MRAPFLVVGVFRADWGNSPGCIVECFVVFLALLCLPAFILAILAFVR